MHIYPKWQRGDTIAERIETARYIRKKNLERSGIKFWTIADYVESKLTPGERLKRILDQCTYDTRELALASGRTAPIDDVIAALKVLHDADPHAFTYSPNVILQRRLLKPSSWFSRFFKGE